MGQKSRPVKEPAEQVIREIRRSTRRQFSAEETRARRGVKFVDVSEARVNGAMLTPSFEVIIDCSWACGRRD